MLNSFTVSRFFSPKNSPQRSRHDFSANLNLEQLEDRKLMAAGAVHQIHLASARLDSTIGHSSHAQILRFEQLRNTTRGSALNYSPLHSSHHGPLTPTSHITLGLQATTQTSNPAADTPVTRLVQSNPSGPLTPTSHITFGLQATTQSSSPAAETQVTQLVQSNPSGPLTPTSHITDGL
jgi:hypothetical protein